MAPLEFWYEFASTYSYPAAMEVEDRARQFGLEIEWRPFLLGPLFFEQSGWSDSPFNIYPAKGKYMWRDMERICDQAGLAFSRPAVFPQNGLLAARTALVGEEEGWIAPFTRAVYSANFSKGQDISEPSIIASLLGDVGADETAVLERAKSPEIKERLKHQTQAAMDKGLFGAPSFFVDGELFWGHDRMDAAIDWAKRH